MAHTKKNVPIDFTGEHRCLSVFFVEPVYYRVQVHNLLVAYNYILSQRELATLKIDPNESFIL